MALWVGVAAGCSTRECNSQNDCPASEACSADGACVASNARARVSYEARDSKPQGGPSLEMATSIFSASVKRSSAAVGHVGGQGPAEPVVGGCAVPVRWLYDQ